jgi:hypothetical protein
MEALKFQAKEFALHLVGCWEPTQMTGLEVCFRRTGQPWEGELKVPVVKLLRG